MAWSPTIPLTPLQQSDMPSGATSQASLFATLGAWYNAIVAATPITAAGTATGNVTTANTPVTINVTFPTGRFATAPNVQVSIDGATSPQNVQVARGSVTTTGFQIYVNRSSSTGMVTVGWLAVLSP